MAAAETMLRKALEVDPKLAKTHFFLGTALKTLGRTTRRSTHLRDGRRAVPARSRGAQPARPRAVPEAPVHGRRRASEGAGDRSRGSAGALQPDAVLSGAGRRGGRRARAGALRALQGGRVRAGDHRPVPAAAPRRQQRAPADPRAPLRRRRRASRRADRARSRGRRRCELSMRRGAGDRVVAARLVARPRVVAVQSRAADAQVTFTDVTAAAGIRFMHNNGAFGKKYLPETMGSGVRVPRRRRRRLAGHPPRQLDELAGPAGARVATARSTATTSDGTFTDVTRGVRPRRGALRHRRAPPPTTTTTATSTSTSPALGGNRLFRNVGGGKFADVTAQAGVGGGGFAHERGCGSTTTSDGKLDLFVAHYVRVVDREGSVLHARRQDASRTARRSRTRGRARSLYPQPRRRHVRGRRREGRSATIRRRRRSGVALLDYDGDGWLDLFVANDTQPNRLYRNKGNGTFTDVGVDGRRRLQRGRRRARRHGRRRRRLRRLRPARASSSATSRTR